MIATNTCCLGTYILTR